MLIIADSGSTKTDWAVLTGQENVVLQTPGINPFMQDEQQISALVQAQLLPQLTRLLTADTPIQLFFYGAGCTPEKTPTVTQALAEGLQMGTDQIQVQSDLMGAARGLLQRQEGIACILGTGSNSCHYDGHTIRANVSPLGFILGDEGSGAVLGKKLLGNCLKHQFSPLVCQAFEEKYHLTTAQIIQRVYREPFPNRYLAGFAPFLYEMREQPEIQQFLIQEFEDFLRRNVLSYAPFQGPVSFTGSIAWHFQEYVQTALSNLHLQAGSIEKSPLQGLIRYHSL